MPYKDPIAQAAYFKAYAAKHREHRNALSRSEKGRARSRRAYWNNREKKLIVKRLNYYEKGGKERLKRWGMEYRKRLAAVIKLRKRLYHAKHRDVLNKQSRERYSNPVLRERSKARLRQANKEGRYALSRLADRSRRQKVKARADNGALVFIKRVRSMKCIPCYYCGTVISGRAAHIEHIIAITKSGNHTSDNLCAACAPCNMSKRTKSLAEWSANSQRLLNL